MVCGQLISDAGYRGEITSASTAAYQPEVFCGLVKNLLSQIIKACNVDLRESFSEFCVSGKSTIYNNISLLPFVVLVWLASSFFAG